MTFDEKILLCDALLSDDYGISERAYQLMLRLELIPASIISVVEATDGRFYLPAD